MLFPLQACLYCAAGSFRRSHCTEHAYSHLCVQEVGVVGKGKGPYAVVMAPTRELALQINQVQHVLACIPPSSLSILRQYC